MAFPTTPILDIGNRVENPISHGGRWSGPILAADTQLKDDGSSILRVGGSSGSGYWNARSIPGDCEVYGTCLGSPTLDQYLFARITNPGGGSMGGYAIEFQNGQWYFQRFFSGNIDTFGGPISHAYSAGDSAGLGIVGYTLTAYHKPAAGDWDVVGSVADGLSSYAFGFIGLWTTSSGGGTGWVNFGGGSVIPAGSIISGPGALRGRVGAIT